MAQKLALLDAGLGVVAGHRSAMARGWGVGLCP